MIWACCWIWDWVSCNFIFKCVWLFPTQPLDLQSSLALDKGSNFTPSSARQEAKKELACYKTRQRQQNQIARILMDPNLSLVRSVSPLKNWQQKDDWCIKGKSEWLMRWGILPFVTLFKSMNALCVFCHVASLLCYYFYTITIDIISIFSDGKWFCSIEAYTDKIYLFYFTESMTDTK